MIHGIGTDIIDIRRIKKVLEKYNEKFKQKCFHKQEIARSDSRYNKVESYAKRYAAKEACAKALGTGLAKGVFWKDIEVKNNSNGKPYISLHNNASRYLEKNFNKNAKIELSLSDEKDFAIANIIIFNETK